MEISYLNRPHQKYIFLLFIFSVAFVATTETMDWETDRQSTKKEREIEKGDGATIGEAEKM